MDHITNYSPELFTLLSLHLSIRLGCKLLSFPFTSFSQLSLDYTCHSWLTKCKCKCNVMLCKFSMGESMLRMVTKTSRHADVSTDPRANRLMMKFVDAEYMCPCFSVVPHKSLSWSLQVLFGYFTSKKRFAKCITRSSNQKCCLCLWKTNYWLFAVSLLISPISNHCFAAAVWHSEQI